MAKFQALNIVLLVAAAVVPTSVAFCYSDVEAACSSKPSDSADDSLLPNCNAKYGGIENLQAELQAYANGHIETSFEFLLMSTHFGSYESNREGFKGLYRKLSDNAWEKAIDLIKYISKRGGRMNFNQLPHFKKSTKDRVLELSELHSLSKALDSEKQLATEALRLHSQAKHHGDAAAAHYLEEEFMEPQTEVDFQKPLVGGETTVQRLVQALHSSRVGFRRLPGFDPSIDNLEYYRLQQMVDCDEVYPRIYIGDGITAKNKQYLQRIGITHVLNAAEGKKFGMVNTSSDYYRETGMRYLGLQMLDLPSTDISQFFYTAAAFIENAVATGGRVYVHCVQGVSRSATLVIAYLMIKKRMLAADAIRTVRLGRDIHPNDGFLRQLARLDNQLRRHRLL
ncbi:hypothetical protein QAD02_022142 [Eretmocerus hayati]|uniref:Uncharacterized protein n=1 Tax=Eretmocerus hayati TaxID=131215 RepID=A0ACC2PS77_9HYME|nr:hypothetical protein QAD02_022142 [Eretmocerus hayati]